MGSFLDKPNHDKDPIHPLIPFGFEELRKIKKDLADFYEVYTKRDNMPLKWKKSLENFMLDTIVDLNKIFNNIDKMETCLKQNRKRNVKSRDGQNTKQSEQRRSPHERSVGPCQHVHHCDECSLQLVKKDSLIEISSQKLEHKKASITQLCNQIEDLKKETESLQKRLSEEWGTKVGKDESSLENINIKNRPMKVTEEYELICSGSWLTAKDVLDEVDMLEKGVPDANIPHYSEAEKVAALCKVMVDAEIIAKKKYMQLSNAMYLMLTIQAEQGTSAVPKKLRHSFVRADSGETKETPVAKDKVDTVFDNIPDGLRNAVGDLLRTAADTSDISGILEGITVDLLMSAKQTPDPSDTATNEVKPSLEEMKRTTLMKREICVMSAKQRRPSEAGFPEIDKYIQDCGRLAWKMVTQRPQMEFDFTTGVGEKFKGEKHQDLAYNSKDPSLADHVVKYYVHPALIHNKAVMRIGRVYVDHKDH